MSADLGARLQRAGLVTREQLAETLATAPLHGAALVRALVRRGISEDALAGYFVAEGFGPLMGPSDLAAADPVLLSQIPPRVMREFAVLPIRAADGSWIVAMLAPTERHVVNELERMSGARVIPAAARWSDLRGALADVGAAMTSDPAPAEPTSEPPVIELVRRRSPASSDSGYRTLSRDEPDEKLALDPSDAVPLVRHKPLARPTSSLPPAEKILARSFAPPRDVPTRAVWARGKSTAPLETVPDAAPPARSPSGSHPAIALPTALELATASAVDALPLSAASVASAPAPETPEPAPTAPSARPAPRVPRPSEPYTRRAVTDAPSASRAQAPRIRTLAPPALSHAPSSHAPSSHAPSSHDPEIIAPERPVDDAPGDATRSAEPVADEAATRERGEVALARTPSLDEPAAPVAEETAVEPIEPIEGPRDVAPDEAIEASLPVESLALPEITAILPDPTAEESWSVLPTSARPAASRVSGNKLSPRATRDLAPSKAPIGDIRGVLVSIRQATDRDEVVRLALDGSLSVSRSAVFFAFRRGLLKGWDGIGSGVTEDSARNLWIPTSTVSLFQRVVETGQGYFGAYGTAIADGLFRAAVGSRGGDLALLPVKVSGKVVGLLACDDVRAGPQGRQRLELVATAVEEAFARIIVRQKQG